MKSICIKKSIVKNILRRGSLRSGHGRGPTRATSQYGLKIFNRLDRLWAQLDMYRISVHGNPFLVTQKSQNDMKNLS